MNLARLGGSLAAVWWLVGLYGGLTGRHAVAATGFIGALGVVVVMLLIEGFTRRNKKGS